MTNTPTTPVIEQMFIAIDTRKRCPASRIWICVAETKEKSIENAKKQRPNISDKSISIYKASEFVRCNYNSGSKPRGRRFYIRDGILHSNFERIAESLKGFINAV